MPEYLRDDVDHFFDYDLHIPSRTIYIGGECDLLQAEYLTKGLHLLKARSLDQTINIIMNNPGGDEYHGMAIYDAIAACKQHVTITAYGHAMSMGSWILQAADDRVLTPNCTVMIHYGTGNFGDDHVKYCRVQAKEMERLNHIMERVYLPRIQEKNPDFPLRKLRKLLEDETFLTAEEAVALGLADRVLY